MKCLNTINTRIIAAKIAIDIGFAIVQLEKVRKHLCLWGEVVDVQKARI